MHITRVAKKLENQGRGRLIARELTHTKQCEKIRNSRRKGVKTKKTPKKIWESWFYIALRVAKKHRYIYALTAEREKPCKTRRAGVKTRKFTRR